MATKTQCRLCGSYIVSDNPNDVGDDMQQHRLAAHDYRPRFRLIGQTTMFEATRFYKAAGFIPSVVGRTLDDKFETCARLADIRWL